MIHVLMAGFVSITLLFGGQARAESHAKDHHSTASAVDKAAQEKIMKMDSIFSQMIASGNAAPLAAGYSNDSILIAANLPVIKGTQAIVGYYQQLISAGVVRLELMPSNIRAIGRASMEHASEYEEIGTYLVTINAGSAKIQIPGNYYDLWSFPKGVSQMPVLLRDISSPSVNTCQAK